MCEIQILKEQKAMSSYQFLQKRNNIRNVEVSFIETTQILGQAWGQQ